MNAESTFRPDGGNGYGPRLHVPPGVPDTSDWRCAVVLVSGRRDGDEALACAAALAAERGMELVAVHVEDGDGTLERAAHYADALHHEYPGQLEEFVARALPHCTADERATVRHVALCRGDPVAELRDVMARERADLLVVGAGDDAGGSALVQRLMDGATYPVLAVRSAARGPFRLKVGKWLG